MATPMTGFLVSVGFCVGVWLVGCVGVAAPHAARETINNMTRRAHKIFFIIFSPFVFLWVGSNGADASYPDYGLSGLSGSSLRQFSFNDP